MKFRVITGRNIKAMIVEGKNPNQPLLQKGCLPLRTQIFKSVLHKYLVASKNAYRRWNIRALKGFENKCFDVKNVKCCKKGYAEA